jgi:tetratricopeptide (TPR) repeat protein
MESSAMDQVRFEEIERYLRGEMSEELAQSFESRLAEDASLRSDLEAIKDSILAIEMGGFKASMQGIGTRYDKENPSISPSRSNPFNLRLFAIAAGIAAVVSVVYLFWPKVDAGKELYAEYFSPDPGLPVTMGITDAYDFKDAMVDYKTGDYTKAIQKWNGLLKESPQSDTLNYYLGCAHLNAGASQKAIEHLKGVRENESSSFQQKAAWYLALAYLQEGRITELKAMDISENEYNGQEFKKLRDQLTH